jgi:hypothetical protein
MGLRGTRVALRGKKGVGFQQGFDHLFEITSDPAIRTRDRPPFRINFETASDSEKRLRTLEIPAHFGTSMLFSRSSVMA